MYIVQLVPVDEILVTFRNRIWRHLEVTEKQNQNSASGPNSHFKHYIDGDYGLQLRIKFPYHKMVSILFIHTKKG